MPFSTSSRKFFSRASTRFRIKARAWSNGFLRLEALLMKLLQSADEPGVFSQLLVVGMDAHVSTFKFWGSGTRRTMVPKSQKLLGRRYYRKTKLFPGSARARLKEAGKVKR